MKYKRIIGIVTSLLLLTNCQKEDIEYAPLNAYIDQTLIGKPLKDKVNNELKSFSNPLTKAVLAPTWENGNLICVYSIDNNDIVTFIDTCAVFDVNETLGKITAEVSKECKGYFAVFPYNHFTYEVGDKIPFGSDRNYGGKCNIDYVRNTGAGNYGKFPYMTMMTSWCSHCEGDGYFLFKNRISLMRVSNIRNADFPMIINIYYRNGNVYSIPKIPSFKNEFFYVPIASEDEWINKIDIEYHNAQTPQIIYPTGIIEVGTIYEVSLKK